MLVLKTKPGKSEVLTNPWDPDLMFLPMCCSCKVPVEKFTLDPLSSRWVLKVHAQCHGKTEYKEVPVSEAIRNKHIRMFERSTFNSLRVAK